MISPDLLIVNANILTMDRQNTRAGSIAVKDGIIEKIWSKDEPPKVEIDFSLKNTTIINLKGNTLIPGFIDTHSHLLMYARFRKQVNCGTPPNNKISEVLEKIKIAANKTPAGEWVLGWGFDDTLMLEQRYMTRNELDAIVPDKPVFIRHISAHFAVANSIALKLAGIDENSNDPAGGHFGRDNRGNLNGILYELPALERFQSVIPLPTTDTIAELIGVASKDYLAQGITTCTDAGVGMDLGMQEFNAHINAVKNNLNPMRMRLMIVNSLLNDKGPFADFTAEELDHHIRMSSFNRVRLDSAKLFQDGSIQGLTGALREPYYGDPDIKGELIFEQNQLNNEILALHKRGFRIAIHGNGDRAIDSIISAYSNALNIEQRQKHRHRIEHVQTVTSEDLDKMADLNIAASFFINHVYYWGDRHKRLFLGPDRAAEINPLADACKKGILYTLHSDCPITPISPLFSIWAAVNRKTREGKILGQHQIISVEEALRAMTLFGARLNFEENEIGSLEIGKRADFAVLNSDPTAINPMQIKEVQVLETYIGGKLVYAHEA